MGRATVLKPAILNNFNDRPTEGIKRVAAYCRVSSDKEEQLKSYGNQVEYFTALIHAKKEWEYVDVYQDEGISGTMADKRDDFLRMIKDAEAGAIDLIVTKSISRFGRNVVDTLTYTRKLKEKGIAVYFEKENINSLEASGELMITILASLAQEESRSISENTKWGILRGFDNGKVFLNSSRFLGYDKNEMGELVINEAEAETVKRIYSEYLEGKSCKKIGTGLELDGIKTPAGKDKWWETTISSILSNEKYYGDLLQQKTVTVDFLSHKRVKNKSYADQYLVEGNHEGIVSREVWDAVQKEKEKRASAKGNVLGDRGKYSSKYPFSGKIVCGDCGAKYRRRHWNSNNDSKKIVWQCSTYFNHGKDACSAKSIDEKVLEQAFVDWFNELYQDRVNVISTMKKNIEEVIKKLNVGVDVDKLEADIEKFKDDIKKLLKLRMAGNIDDEVYREENTRLNGALNELREQREAVISDEERKVEMINRIDEIERVLGSKEGLLDEFDGDLFGTLVDRVEIGESGEIEFCIE